MLCWFSGVHLIAGVRQKEEKMNNYINLTIRHMCDFGFQLRDTFHPEHNYDDYYTNNNSYNGKRQFEVIWVETDGYPSISANKRYNVPPLECVAYDSYKIEMPNRYKLSSREDVVIHETVHFLQWNTSELDDNYVQYDGSNYREYIGQRSEMEAHLVQVSYILESMQQYFFEKVQSDLRAYFLQTISELKESMDHGKALNMLLKAKEVGLI
ncbi:hypothetical protein ACCE85_003004 [Photobacterium damselae]